MLARVVSKSSKAVFGQTMVVENRAGAGGAIGTESLLRSEPDGHHLLMASVDTNSIYQHLYTRPQYDGSTFPAVAPVAKIELVLVSRPGLGVATIEDLFQLAKQKQLTYASWGAGTVSNLAMLAFIQKTGLPEMLHVPYQGAALAARAALSQEVDLVMAVMPVAKPQTSLKPIAVVTRERSRHMPDVPTLKEQGVDLALEAWIGVVAPPKTPEPVVRALGAGFEKINSQPDVVKSIEEAGFAPFNVSSEEFQTYLNEQNRQWKEIVKASSVKLD